MQSTDQPNVHTQCEMIAEDWVDLLVEHNCSSLPRSKLHCYILLLTKQLIAAMRTDPVDRDMVQAVGAAVATLCDANETVLGRTQEFIAHHLLRLSDTEVAFQPHLVTLLSELSVGFMRQARMELMLPQEVLPTEPMPTVAQERDKPQTNMLLTSLPIVFFTTDRNGIITSSEGQGLQRLGIPAEQLVGQPVAHICHTFFPQDAESILRHVQRALDGESLQAVGTAGDIVFEMQYEPIRDEHGAIIGVTGVALDITEQTRAKRELAEARSRLSESQELQQLRLAVEHLTQSTHASTTNVALSEREIKLMRLVVAGKTNQSISQELEITKRTVTNRLNSVIEKLGVNSRAEVIRRVVELGLFRE